MTRLIVVDATPYGPEPSGTKRRCVELLRRLPALLPDDVFEVHWAKDGGGPAEGLVADAFVKPDNVVHATVDVSCRGGAMRWAARRRDLLRRHREAPFTHLLVDHGPVVAPGRVRTIVTLHDLRFLHGYGGILRRLYGRFRYGASLRRAAVTVAVSAVVREEAMRALHLAPGPMLAVDAPGEPFHGIPAARVEDMRARLSVAGEYLLVVGRDEPRKALGAAVAAWKDGPAARGVSLVVAGARGFAAQGVRSLGDVADADLAALYAGATATFCPSLHEGYGMTVVESLACGTPVVASDIPAHRELYTDGARGLFLVPPPTKTAGRWSWPGAADAIPAGRPREVAPPPHSWDVTAAIVAGAIRG